MAWANAIKPLSTVGGLPVVPGASKVTAEIPRYYVAYGGPVAYRYFTLAIIYKDDSGNYLVSAEQSFLNTLPGGQSLQSLIAASPGNWRTYKGAFKDGGQFYDRSNGYGAIPIGILTALGVEAPLPLALMPSKFQGLYDCIGLQGSSTHRMGLDGEFHPELIEAGTTYYGDTLE